MRVKEACISRSSTFKTHKSNVLLVLCNFSIVRCFQIDNEPCDISRNRVMKNSKVNTIIRASLADTANSNNSDM